MTTIIKASMMVKVMDQTALHASAARSFVASGACSEEVGPWLGTIDRPDVPNCVTQLLGDLETESGATIVECEAKSIDPDRSVFRTVVTACVSTSHITYEELKRIETSFEMEKAIVGHTCRDEIVHDGLRMTPMDAGFIVRIPGDERMRGIRASWTPEMTAVLDLAIEQGAGRIEFHADEEEIEGIEIHEH